MLEPIALIASPWIAIKKVNIFHPVRFCFFFFSNLIFHELECDLRWNDHTILQEIFYLFLHFKICAR